VKQILIVTLQCVTVFLALASPPALQLAGTAVGRWVCFHVCSLKGGSSHYGKPWLYEYMNSAVSATLIITDGSSV